MTKTRTYLDYNASAPLLAEARAAAIAALDSANPSSVHSEGRAARQMADRARRSVAALVGGEAEHVIFTSGATEAAATLLSPDWRMGRSALRFSKLYVCEADHACTLGGGRFDAGDVVRFGVDVNGIADLAGLESVLAQHDREAGLPLVAVHAANNETGVIQPVQEIARVVKAAGGVLIVDAVQAVGRISIEITNDCGDFFILSAHKIGGPKGVGAFVGRSDLMMPVPLITGGGQEKGHRAGTENLSGIAGFGAAAEIAAAGFDAMDAMRNLRDKAEAALLQQFPGAIIHGKSVARLANTSLFTIPGLKAETALIAFDLAGIAVSSGSACSSGRVGPSHVLKAMGFDAEEGAIRLSTGPETTQADIGRFEAALADIAARRGGRPKAA
ncbi:cysteine desulfurase family protein [Mesorhizobium sp. Z1-4]|uniref:cysteine desulfurase family protein n=1 Tax=Mesorhizobium sp. Z1-4 TaxID=2448478 RepID=UPI000FDA8835|nr:cysteine desulfurase family protein [Mesorhizobium sp. Z1-4]